MPTPSNPRLTSQTIPTGTVHALEAAGSSVACGRPAEGLTPFFTYDWNRLGVSLEACAGCIAVLAPTA